ncbi:PLP-dependent aminotransferase family protein [Variovorax sp. M-6]|uniref:MocR-like pyridoxine biosynthesis transcription factor PdxR n=1 Tax=Variovorax sp. M-6 TaxID=3233041 RepID=UPI003F971385
MARKFNYPTWSALSLDRGNSMPLHVQVFDQIRQAIVQGRISKSSRLPPTRQLAAELAVSRNTIVQVYERLLAEGYVSGRVGAGTYIASVLPEERHPPKEALPTAPPSPAATGSVSRRAQAVRPLRLPSERSGSLDLSPTVPALDQLPFDQFAKVSAHYWRSAPAADLGYGGSQGLPDLRRQIASYLGEAHGVPCLAEQVLVVSGTTQGFMLAAHVLTDHGDQVIVEDPGYVTRHAALIGAGAELVHVPIDLDGLDSSRFDGYAPGAKMVIASPTNQFPFGSTMPLERRLSLLQWAQTRDAWVIEYDFNNAFHFGGRPLPPLAALDRSGRVVYIGNFNRSISPALNIAYAIVPPGLIDAFARAHQIFSFHASVPTQGVVADFMESGQLAAHIRRMGSRYRERAHLLVHCLKTLAGSAFELSTTGAGLHLSAVAKTPIDDLAVSQTLLQHRIDVPAMSSYCMTDPVRTGFVFGFGNTPAERIAPAIRLFSDAVSTHSEAPIRDRAKGAVSA